MNACQCKSRAGIFFARVRFTNGVVHVRAVCPQCFGNSRGAGVNVPQLELIKRGLDVQALPWVSLTGPPTPPRVVQVDLFDDQE